METYNSIEVTKQLVKDGKISQEIAETIFPELKESEDERIRKEMLDFFKQFYDIKNIKSIDVEPWISWLEKQGNQKPIIPWKYKKDHTPLFRDSLILNKYGCVANSPSGSIVSDAWVLDFDALAKLPKEELEKQGSQILANSAKTCKDEPKFKVGDWIVYNDDICQIVRREEGCNKLVTNFGIEKELVNERNLSTARPWTIQDAKDGDVLSNEEMVVIFKHFEEPPYRQHIVAYIGLDTCGNIQITNDTWTLGIDKAKPATKEQRDLLFQKMKEAGYEWDAEKKELRKIEQNPAWSEKNEAVLDALIRRLEGEDIYVSPHLAVECLKSLKERVLPQPKREWSEEDEQYLLVCKNALVKYQTTDKWDASIISHWLEDRLKALKERCTWKPSDEQMEALSNALGLANNCGEESSYYLKTLHEQLEKLKQ